MSFLCHFISIEYSSKNSKLALYRIPIPILTSIKHKTMAVIGITAGSQAPSNLSKAAPQHTYKKQIASLSFSILCTGIEMTKRANRSPINRIIYESKSTMVSSILVSKSSSLSNFSQTINLTGFLIAFLAASLSMLMWNFELSEELRSSVFSTRQECIPE